MRAIKPRLASRYAARSGDSQVTIATPAARTGTAVFLGVFSLAVLAPAAHAQAASSVTALTPTVLARLGPDQVRTVFRAAAVRPAGYTVRPGDTLSGISARLFGNPDKWPWLYDYNKKIIGDNPDLIVPGEKLTAVLGARPEYGDAVAAVTRARQAVSDYRAAAVSYQPAAQEAPVSGGSYEDCVIARESSGDASAVNPSSGAGGLFGFLPSTWASLGYSGLPEDAPVSVQDQAFAREYAKDGTSPWISDGC